MTDKKLTNEQAINVLDVLWNNPLFSETHKQAFEIGIKAIKALEQEPKSEWQQDHEILKAYSDGANEMIDKIRAEVESINPWALEYAPSEDKDIRPQIVTNVKGHVLEIIDKYKAEGER